MLQSVSNIDNVVSNMISEEVLIKIIRCILDPNVSDYEITVENWKELISLAKKNGVFQYVYRYMKSLDPQNHPSSDITLYMDKLNAMELRTGILQDYSIETLRNRFEEKGVDHIFIKGSVTKSRYPDQYLRSMGDIDLLYKPEQHKILCDQMEVLGYNTRHVGRVHDIYINDSNIAVEAHRQLVSSSSTYYKFCENIWDRVEKRQDYQYEYMMQLEDEFLFNFIHLASHFKKGGIGIRFIVDIWIYKQLDMNWEYIKDRLECLNLTRLYTAIDMLSEKWFGKKENHYGFINDIENYILSGGVFGNSENRKNAVVKNGKVKYFFKICFPNYDEMKSMFPSLKHKAMLPAAWLYRVFQSIIKRRKNVKALLEPIKSGNMDEAIEMKQFFKKYGLD